MLRYNTDDNTVTTTTKDGMRIFYKDWGVGRPVVFSRGWPLNADAWDAQMLFLVRNGYPVIAHDRRGHGMRGIHRHRIGRMELGGQNGGRQTS